MGNIKQLGVFLLAVLLTSELGMYGNIAMASWWIQGTGPAGSISDYNHTFTTRTPTDMSCVIACKRSPFPCSMVSYNTTIQECQGYEPIQQQLKEPDNNTIWTLVERPIFCRVPGYDFHPAFHTCIRMYNVKVTWSEAESLCRKDTAYLIVVDSWVKMDAFSNTFPGFYGWIGLREYVTTVDGRNFEWINGQYQTENSSLWGPGDPSSSIEQCVDIGYHQGRLNDNYCGVKLDYICQQDL
ncbi:C-type lectin domain family 4 member E-like [Mizuhopecten yessoensis]|uniref:Brevican core protein n=1 Tax=Mizuhopecten yessoensis TaxID=6573 RepID=A0A210Q8H4_MIZYE|nr:C-type lectin domain family 4 member E-like [Mizuhopecten yessoensis]OWF45050.1 Brevican core protein [Mizuhopecten yessoensis]